MLPVKVWPGNKARGLLLLLLEGLRSPSSVHFHLCYMLGDEQRLRSREGSVCVCGRLSDHIQDIQEHQERGAVQGNPKEALQPCALCRLLGQWAGVTHFFGRMEVAPPSAAMCFWPPCPLVFGVISALLLKAGKK